MRWVPGGSFPMGAEDFHPDADERSGPSVVARNRRA
jgi:hypothetical protein